MAEVSDQDLKCIQEALKIGWDRTGADLGAVLRSAGFQVTDELAEKIRADLNINQKEPLTATVVCMAAAKIPDEGQARTLMREAFKIMDKHGDGSITVTDLRIVLTNMGDIKQDELDMIIEELDPDDMGRVYLDEVCRVFASKNLLA